MEGYTIFNLALTLFAVLIFATFSAPKRQAKLIFRVGFIITCITFPWDFLAIHLSAWDYPVDPGQRIVSVPVNDLYLAFIVTVITTSILCMVPLRGSLVSPRTNHEPESEHRDNK
jgi:hypothetical protein